MSQDENSHNESTKSAQDQLLSDILQRFAQNSSPSQARNPTGDILSSLLSNGELISKLPQIISLVKPMLDLWGGASQSKTESAPKETQRSAPSLPAHPAAATRSKSEADRSALLCAMKPYLSQNAIDYIIKLSRLGDILKTL